MKKMLLIILASICIVASVWAASDRVNVNTVLNFSKPGGVKSDSIPRMLVGDTWNMEFSLDITSKASIGSFFNGVGNIITGDEVVLLACIESNMSIEECSLISSKNIIGDYVDDVNESEQKKIFFAFSPKQKNQQLTVQFNPKKKGENSLTITFFYVGSADEAFYTSKKISELFAEEKSSVGKGFTWVNDKTGWDLNLAEKTQSKYDLKKLNNSTVSYRFIVE